MKFVYLSIVIILVSCGANKSDQSHESKGQVSSTNLSYTSINDVLDKFPKSLIEKYGGGTLAKGTPTFLSVEGKTLDSDVSLAVLVTIVDPGGAGGRSYQDFLAVFSKSNEKYLFRGSRRVGGRMFREVKLKSVDFGGATLDALFYREDDPTCCPSIKGYVAYELDSTGTLEEGLSTISKSESSSVSSEESSASSSENSSVQSEPLPLKSE